MPLLEMLVVTKWTKIRCQACNALLVPRCWHFLVMNVLECTILLFGVFGALLMQAPGIFILACAIDFGARILLLLRMLEVEKEAKA